jgi:hypothetical protein
MYTNGTIKSFYRPTREINRLLTAAVVSESFRRQLLTNPAQALADGYNGMRFSLSRQEEELLLSIKAHSLNDLALQVNAPAAGPQLAS